MFQIKTPCSTSNLGPGFDCLGLAFQKYNTFTVEAAQDTKLFQVEERYNNLDNLFLKSYFYACEKLGVNQPIHVTFDCDIPPSRGLGSSSSLIVGGVFAANEFAAKKASKDELFQIASEMEGHPDNAAPCVYGGLTASTKLDDNSFLTRSLPISKKWKWTIAIPNFEVSTQKAREILPESYSKREAIDTLSNAILSAHALSTFDLPLLKQVSKDFIHEPYRKQLIPDYEILEEVFSKYKDGVLHISGSGSTCLYISAESLPQECIDELNTKTNAHWNVQEVSIAFNGTEAIQYEK